MNEPATTIPDIEADAVSPAGRLVVSRDGWPPTPGLSPEPTVFPAVSGLSHRHPPLLLPGCDGVAPCGIAAHDVCQLPDQIRRRQRTALGWQFFVVPRFTSLSNSGRVLAPRYRRRNQSAPWIGTPASLRAGDGFTNLVVGSPDSPGLSTTRSRGGTRTTRSRRYMPLLLRPMARSISRLESRSAIAWRLSAF